MGPTKALVKNYAIYEATTGTPLIARFVNHDEVTHYANHHYMVLPVHDHHGKPWRLDGKLIYRLHGVTYETVDHKRVPLSRCNDCGGMGIPMDEPNVESDCFQCTACGQEFSVRLAMMES
jgi:hypothetical protein